MENQERLRQSNTDEFLYKTIKKELQYYEEKSSSRVADLLAFVPCILHMENRSGIKMLSMIVQEGMHNMHKQLTFQQTKGKNKRLNLYISKLEEQVNLTI